MLEIEGGFQKVGRIVLIERDHLRKDTLNRSEQVMLFREGTSERGNRERNGKRKGGGRVKDGRVIEIRSQGTTAKISELKAENEATKRSSKVAFYRFTVHFSNTGSCYKSKATRNFKQRNSMI